MVDINVRLAGAAGQGLQSAGGFFGQACVRAGYHVFGIQDNMSRIRGGHNFYHLRVSDKPVSAMTRGIDVLVMLDKDSLTEDLPELNETGMAIMDAAALKASSDDSRVMDVPFKKIAMDKGGKPLFSNSAAIGYLFATLGLDLSLLNEQFEQKFKDDVLRGNIDSAQEGYNQAADVKEKIASLVTKEGAKRLFLNGNHAVALGAAAANLKFISCYPMSPSTGIITYLANTDVGIVTEQAEDEIAAVNQAVGASMAGVRAMTATSGGGMALMSETISLAGIAETPLVIVNCQRGGPGTGLPTRPEQSDLLFSVFTGHGEFPRAVLAPSNAQEAFYATAKAFELADKYQMPVIVLSDQHIADSFYTVDEFDLGKVNNRSYMLSDSEANALEEYNRYAITDSGISPRSYPGQSQHIVFTDSHEHTENVEISEDPEVRKAMVEKRARKTTGLPASFSLRQHGMLDAEVAVVSWGSTGDTLQEAVERLANQGHAINMIQMGEIWPFPVDQFVAVTEKAKRIVTVEGNEMGQLAMLIAQSTHYHDIDILKKYDGRPFNVEDLTKALLEVIK